MIDTEKLEELIAQYKIDFPKHWEEEKYKWEAVKCFQDNWDIDAPNFLDMFTKATEKIGRLKDILNYFPLNGIKILAEYEQEKARKIFVELFDEQKELSFRIQNFLEYWAEIKSMYKDKNIEESAKKKISNSIQDLRSISVFLSLAYPDKYFMYRPQECVWSYNELEIDKTIKSGRNPQILKSYYEFCNEIYDFITKKYPELSNWVQDFLTKDEYSYSDPKLRILIHDILLYYYQISNQKVPNKEQNLDLPEVEITEKGSKMMSYPKNQILYGPPGTGKTYNTILKAMEIITFEEMFKNWFISIRQKGSENALDDYVKHIHKISNEYLKTQNIFSICDKDKVVSIKNKVSSSYKPALDSYGEFLEYLGEGTEKYAKIRAEFERMKANGRIDFITFHQSYSYEEFVEGIKPELSDNEESGLKYTLSDGIFKKICNNARLVKSEQRGQKIDFSKTRIFKMSLGGLSDASIYQYCIDNDVVSLGWGDNVDYSSAKTLEDIKDLYNKETGKDDWAPYAIYRFKNWMRKGDIIIISNRTRNFSAIAKVIGDYEYVENPDINYHHFRKVQWLYKGDEIPVSKIYDKYLSQQSIYAFYNEAKEGQTDYNSTIKTDVLNDIITGDIKNKENETYVLVIDEINRGNISKIFGELITLIEEDKRGVLSATLPYSQKSFTVPENLYIIGTMNTADRSIATIDIALRRRFKFVEMMPKSELVSTDIEGINLQKVMDNLNKRITVLLDRDHQIGHAYFMNIETIEQLMNVWYSKILPLLNEYFYGDWNKLKLLVLPFINKEEIPQDLRAECMEEQIYSFKLLHETEFKEAIKELE